MWIYLKHLRVLKNLLFILFLIVISLPGFSQKNTVSLYSGIADLDGAEFGFNIEFSIEREILKNVSLGINYGNSGLNNFPDFFQFEQQSINGVPFEVNDFILGLSQNEAFNLNWENQTENYYQLFIKYDLPFKILDFNIEVASGLLHTNRKLTLFFLDRFSLSPTGNVAEYDPDFNFGHLNEIGWLLSAGVKKQIWDNYFFHINGKFNISSGADGFDSVSKLYRMGVSRRF